MPTKRTWLDAPTPDTLRALADSGRCIDFYDVEMHLITMGHSAEIARKATLDADFRRDLNERCGVARTGWRLRA